MVEVPAGPFIMGCRVGRDSECTQHERPRHELHLDGYFIDRTEVTVADYRRCYQANGCEVARLAKQNDLGGVAVECNWDRSGRDRHPINCVTWHDAKAFCSWAGKRLPTEAEWEKAACGTDGRVFPWGSDTPGDDLVVIPHLRGEKNEPPREPHINSSWPVGSKPDGQSPYGALDMLGNVWEWTADWYDRAAYTKSLRRNPQGSTTGAFRVIRGDIDPSFMRNSQRNKLAPGTRLGMLGFRCARSTR